MIKPQPSVTGLDGRLSSLGNHRPEFLWNLSRNELVTTKFMRNRTLFSTLAQDLLPRLRKQKGGPLRLLFWACSTGCEPYTLKLLLGPDSTDEIIGIDQDAEAVRHARLGAYHPDTWTMFVGQKNLLTETEVSQLFEPVTDPNLKTYKVAEAYRKNISFLTGNLFAAEPAVPLESFDLVVCNNLLLHLKPVSANLAWDYLHRYLNADGLLLVAGCNPQVRAAAAKRLSLSPWAERLSEISKNWHGVSGGWNFNPRPAWAYPEPDEHDPDYQFLAGEIFQKQKRNDEENPVFKNLPTRSGAATSSSSVRIKNIVISGTNFWNPGDDFVRDGVIRVLREVFAGEPLNFLFYNFNPDFFPQEKFAGIGNYVSKGDLEKYRGFVDAVVIAGLSAGDEIKDLYRWVVANGLAEKVYLIGAGYENNYVADHVSQEPEATIFRKARIILGRTAKTPEFIRAAGMPYVHVNCPAILSVPAVKKIVPGHKIQRIGFSIQLPPGVGLPNHSCALVQYKLAVEILGALSREHEVEIIAHHKTEYFHFLELFRGRPVPVIFSSFYQDLHQVYPRYDLIVTTRLHSSLFANGHGIPGIIINDTDRHTHALEGFPHSTWVTDREGFQRAFKAVCGRSLTDIAHEAGNFKRELLAKYVSVLSNAFQANPRAAADSYVFESEKKEQMLVRSLVKPGMVVFDVGANIGKYTKLFSLLAGESGKVFAFEPDPDSAQQVNKLVADDALANVRVLNQAVSEASGKVTLNRFPEEYCSWNSLGRPQMEDPKNPSQFVPIVSSVEVEAVTLDEFCRQHGITQIDYLKLDVEGAEFRALQGGQGLLKKQAVRFLQFEVSLKMLEGLNTSARPVFDLLASFGYECHAISESGEMLDVVSDSNEFYENYIAVPVKALADNGLPIHFFTIVLNGQPFIRHHLETFKNLPFDWHWHIVEGVAELNHDTSWSKPTGGKIPDQLHRGGLSVDGTTEYLDALKKEFPDHVTIYRPAPGKFWDGKREMVNAPLSNLPEQCLLWQVDADELWTFSQIIRTRSLFLAHPKKTAALFYCDYFVGPELVITSRDTYGNNSSHEWLRVWRYQSGDRWLSHEPPRLCRGDRDVALLDVFRHAETEAMGLVFQHFAYAIEEQVHFKEIYYGYAGAVEQWHQLQRTKTFPQKLSARFAWVKDEAIVNTIASAGIKRIAPDEWLGIETANHASLMDDAERILFVRTDSIGDAVLASSMLAPLRKKYPRAKLAVLCQQHVAELFAASPFVDAIIAYDRKKMEVAAEYAQIVSEIAAFNPDVILNSARSRDHFSNQITQAFRGARHIAIEGDRNNISEADHTQSLGGYELLIPTSKTRQTELARHADFLRGLGIEAKNLRPVVWTSRDDEALADAFFKQHNLDPQKTIAVFPGAQHEIRVYRGYAEALKTLAGFRFLIFGDAAQSKLAVEIGSPLGGRALNLCGRSTLRETAALVRRCRLYVGAESAGAHLACAVGVPNVVLLGGGHFGRFMPYSSLTSAVVLPLDCFDCDWRCPHERAHCIKDVAPEILIEAIHGTLEKKSMRPRIFLQPSVLWQRENNFPAWKNPASLLKETEAEIIEVSAIARQNLPAENRNNQAVTAICPVCQNVAPANIVKKNQQYHLCPKCDCVFTPHIEAAVLQTENNGHSARHNQNQDAIRLQRLTKALGRRAEHVIDFGCGQGETTRFIQAQGVHAIGIDQDTALQLPDVADDSMDGILMVEVIEHLYAPRAIFQQFNRVLKLGGVIYVESSFADKKDFAAWHYLDPAIGHCTVHSVRSMALLAHQAGFGISWLNPNVCCFTKNVALKLTAENLAPENIEIIGDGIVDPVVTVVVSTYQSEKFIRPCLENLTRQKNFDRCEIIVVDSGSPENERAIVAEFQQKFPNIRYVRTPRETLYGAWNRGLALARGRYWANVNTDDGLRDDALEILAAALDKHSGCALAYADVAWTSQANDVFPSTHIVRTVKYPDYAPVETLFYCITGCLQFFRTDSLRQLGGFDASLRCAGDYEATLKMMAAKMNAVHVPETLSLFYQNTSGLTQASNRAALEHDQAMNQYRVHLDIANIFKIETGSSRAAANAWAMLGVRAAKFPVPWEDKPFENTDFAFACFHKALELDPENVAAGMNLVALNQKLNRLAASEKELIRRWPKMREWISSFCAGEGAPIPVVRHALAGPVYRPAEWRNRPTAGSLTHEPEALRPWIYRIDGRHVYLSEELFPRPFGLRYQPEELQAVAKKLILLLKELPEFYAHFGGAGDALLLLAAFYDQSPDGIIFSYANNIGAAQALFDAFPKLSKIYFLPQHAEPFFHVALRFALISQLRNCLGAGATPLDSYDVEWKAGLDIEKKYRIKKTPRWAADFRRNENSKQIAVAPKGSLSGMVGSKRNIILPEIWPQVLAHIQSRGFEPVILGTPAEAKEYPALFGCVDARTESFTGQMQRTGQCAGLVGADSWAKTFSALAEIPTLVFEPLKSADIITWKDASDWVFIEPWPAIKMIRSLEDFRREFDARLAKIPGALVLDNSNAAIAWEGSFLDYGSLSHINRELTARLSENFNLTCVGANTLAANAKSDLAMQRCAKTLAAKAPANVAVTVRHQWPPNWSRPESGALVVIQPWEYGSLPKAWVANEKNVDEFWVPSPIVRAMYLNSGIAPEKVRVIPNGVDTEKFHPGVRPLKLPTKKKFKFLFVGGTIFRKGPDILLEAFLQAFTAADDVCLVVKDFGGDSFYRGQTAEAAIRAMQNNPAAPEIVHLTSEISAAEMPSLYAACDCLVLPYRGEGFGMPVLEAMACGLPVIVTNGGATDSFVSADAGWKIPGRGVFLKDHVGEIPLVKNGWLLEPSKAHLVTILKIAASRPDECKKRGANGRAIAVKKFDWKDIAATVAHRLHELVEMTALGKIGVPFRGGTISTAQNNQTPTVQLKKTESPVVAQIGRLDEARKLLGQKKNQAAWNAMLAALAKRPFHPEAFLLLAEIALAAGDPALARQCAQRARDFAPGWNAPKQFLKKPLKGNAKIEWLKLPPTFNSQLSTQTPNLSVCLIVKNEEKFLAACLKSVRGLAQQIIVVDTGSTDRTVEIAKEFGAEIYSFVWNDSFADARNAALEHATGDWILMLDADEEILAEQASRLRADMNKSAALALRLPLVNRGHEAEGRNFVPRLFRNAPGIFYSGRVHEQIFPSLAPHGKAWGLEIGFGTAELLHHGYTPELVRDRNKIERNLNLLRQAVAENPHDANLMMNFGLELVRSDDLAGGVEKYRAAFQLMSAQKADDVAEELREVLLTQFTCQLYKIRAHEEVVRVFNSPLAKIGGLTASHHFALGLALFELKQFGAAAEQMRECVGKRRRPILSPINTDIVTAAPNHCLALCLAKTGDAAGAEKAFQVALTEQGAASEVKLDYAKFLAAQNRAVEAFHKLHELVAVNPRNLAAWRLGGEIALTRAEFLEFGRDWTGEAMRYLPEDFTVSAQRAEVLMLGGETPAAMELWERLWNSERQPNILAALILCETVEARGKHAPDKIVDEPATSRAFIKWYQRLIAMRAHAVIGRINSRLEKLSGPLPTAAAMLEKALLEPQRS